jgi:hypothetical protein
MSACQGSELKNESISNRIVSMAALSKEESWREGRVGVGGENNEALFGMVAGADRGGWRRSRRACLAAALLRAARAPPARQAGVVASSQRHRAWRAMRAPRAAGDLGSNEDEIAI